MAAIIFTWSGKWSVNEMWKTNLMAFRNISFNQSRPEFFLRLLMCLGSDRYCVSVEAFSVVYI